MRTVGGKLPEINSGCTLCPLNESAKTVCVPGRGASQDVKIILVGEAPGPEEDSRGTPFVGKSGQLLDELLSSAGIDVSSVRWENVVRCFPNVGGSTKAPTPTEIEACSPYLYTILSKIKDSGAPLPIIVALGNTALGALTGHRAITRNRGIPFPLLVPDEYSSLREYTVIGTIHPSAVLRGNANARGKIVADLKLAWSMVTGQLPDYGGEYRLLTDIHSIEEYVNEALEKYRSGAIKWFSLDLETTGLDMYDPESKIVSVNLCFEAKKAVLIPFYHKDSPWLNDSFAEKAAIAQVVRLLAKIPVVGWNFKFDLKWLLLKWGVKHFQIGFDGFLAHHWIFGDTRPHDLNTVAAEDLGFVGHGRGMESALQTLDKEQRHMGNVDLPLLLLYGAGDADATLQMCDRLAATFDKIKLRDSYHRLMVDPISYVARMEIAGVKVDPAVTEFLDESYPSQYVPLEEAVRKSKWGEATQDALASAVRKKGQKPLQFSLGSVETLRILVIDKMGLQSPKVSKKTKNASLDKETLLVLKERCEDNGDNAKAEMLGNIILWRTKKKYHSTYIKGMKEISYPDDFFRTTYKLDGTLTGRHSSSDPSIHTIPKGSDIRYQFISRWRGEGGFILSADMGQAEMRVAASLSEDAAFIDIIKSGVDMHKANAAKIFKVPVDEVTSKQRDIAKTAGFGVLYGISAQRLAKTTKISEIEAENVIKEFFSAYPGLNTWMGKVFKEAQTTGYVTTPFGRLRWIQDARTAQWGDRSWRQAINSPIQSSASDVTFLALLESMKEFDRLGMKSLVFGFIHDAIVVDVYPGELFQVQAILHDKMTVWTEKEFPWLKVPMTADFDLCPGWGFPCDLTVVDSTSTISGAPDRIYRVLRELRSLPYKIESKDESVDKKGDPVVTLKVTKE